LKLVDEQLFRIGQKIETLDLREIIGQEFPETVRCGMPRTGFAIVTDVVRNPHIVMGFDINPDHAAFHHWSPRSVSRNLGPGCFKLISF
jgi:hypothetical protein